MARTVAEFIRESFDIISATGPSVPMRNDDLIKGLRVFNDLIASYGINGLLNPISNEILVPVKGHQRDIIFSDDTILFPNADVKTGKLVAIQNAWVEFQGVIYPMMQSSRDRFNSTARFNAQSGLPLQYIIFDEQNSTRLRLWPAPVQSYVIGIDGKIQPQQISLGTPFTGFPSYMILFLRFATAKMMAYSLNRVSAWTQDLEAVYANLEREMINKSPVNVDLGRPDNSLNGAALVASGLFLYDGY